MSDPAPHELPSALSSLFESPHHHFLPASGDDESILIDSDLLPPATTEAVAAAAAAAAAAQHQDEARAQGDTDAAAAAVLELAAAGAGDVGVGVGAEGQGQDLGSGVVGEGSQEGDKRADDETLRLIAASTPALGKYRPRRADPSPLDVTLFALIGENERLRKVVNLLQRPPPVDDTEDVLAEATLRELATAAVGGPIAFGFESLQHQLEQHARNMETIGDNSEFSPSDYASGLVTQVTGYTSGGEGSNGNGNGNGSGSATPPAPGPSDPFLITRLALEDDIARTRAAIAAKEAEVAAVRAGVLPSAPTQPEDRAALEAQLARTTTLVETVGRNVSVLRDIAAKLQTSHDELAADVKDKQAEIAALEDDGTAAEGARALLEVRAYIESAIKLWRERGQLPPAPLPPIPILRDLPAPPSALPKKRGRPARSTQKPVIVPTALAHLVPDPESVKARESSAPIRRKGVKRGKVELEKEKQREEEEGEMLRNLVGMGVWS